MKSSAVIHGLEHAKADAMPSTYLLFVDIFRKTSGVMTSKEFISLALSFPGTEAAQHFDRTAFKVIGKRIFATIHELTSTVNVRLSPADQKALCKFDKKVLYPVDNKWGLQGWTTLELKTAPEELIREALETSYREVFKKSSLKK